MVQFIGVMSDHITTRDLCDIFLGNDSFSNVCYFQLILLHTAFLNFTMFLSIFQYPGCFFLFSVGNCNYMNFFYQVYIFCELIWQGEAVFIN